MASWDLTEVVNSIIDFRDQRDWKKFHSPQNLSAALSIESCELQELFLWRLKESSDEVKNDRVRMAAISDELADITTYLLLIAHDLDIDLKEAVVSKMKKNENRYPVTCCKGIGKKSDF